MEPKPAPPPQENYVDPVDDILASGRYLSPHIETYLRQYYRHQWEKEQRKLHPEYYRKPKPRLSKIQQLGGRKGQKAPSRIYAKGYFHWWLPDLAMMRQVTYETILRFAKRHPELTHREGRWIYCRDEVPPPRHPNSIVKDGHEYFTYPELAHRRHVTPAAARQWALRRPHLITIHNGRPYARDEDWRPKTSPAYIWKDGLQYFSVPELARRRGLQTQAVIAWAHRYPHLTMREGRFIYARDEEWRPMRAEPYLWKDSQVYYSLEELARRRGLSNEPVREWAHKNPHLTIKDGRYYFCRDEEWTSRDPHYTRPPDPPPPPPAPPIEAEKYLLATAARRSKRSSPA